MPKAKIPNLTNPQDLATLLDFSLKDLYSKVHAAKYKVFVVPKKAGGHRVIHSPAGKLALIQRRLAKILADAYGSRSPVHGFALGRSIKSNARSHLDADLVFTCDIEDFFPSIHFGRVRGLFMGKPYLYPKDVAQLIARICCHKGFLPQGAPTSPIVSNLVCGKLDSDLKHFARQHRCCYTRYADDLSFSIKGLAFPKALVDQDATGAYVPGGVLTAILATSHFKINPLKTRLMKPGSRREVTGVILGSRGLNLERSRIRQIRCMLHAWEVKGLEAAEQEFLQKFDLRKRPYVDFGAVVRGRIEHLGFIRGRDNEIYLKLFKRYLKLHPKSNFTPIEITEHAEPLVQFHGVYVLRANKPDGLEIDSTAFFLKGVGIVTACHAVREFRGSSYKNPIIFREGPNLDGIPVQVVKLMEHQDLAVLKPVKAFTPLVEFTSAPPAPQGAAVNLIGYPNYNHGNPVSVASGQLIRQQVFQGINQFIISPTINGGNSGGPILDGKNRVIGVAVKGATVTENIGTCIGDLNSPANP